MREAEIRDGIRRLGEVRLNAIRRVRSSLSLESGTANNKKSGPSQPRIRSRIVMPALSQVHSSNHSGWN
jgi:hypothetical protein